VTQTRLSKLNTHIHTYPLPLWCGGSHAKCPNSPSNQHPSTAGTMLHLLSTLHNQQLRTHSAHTLRKMPRARAVPYFVPNMRPWAGKHVRPCQQPAATSTNPHSQTTKKAPISCGCPYHRHSPLGCKQLTDIVSTHTSCQTHTLHVTLATVRRSQHTSCPSALRVGIHPQVGDQLISRSTALVTAFACYNSCSKQRNSCAVRWPGLADRPKLSDSN
jgi:hypothetical protein